MIVLTKTEKTLQVQDGNEDVAASGSGCRKSLGGGGGQGGATGGGIVGGSNGSAYEVKRRRREEEIAEESSPQPSKENAQVISLPFTFHGRTFKTESDIHYRLEVGDLCSPNSINSKIVHSLLFENEIKQDRYDDFL